MGADNLQFRASFRLSKSHQEKIGCSLSVLRSGTCIDKAYSDTLSDWIYNNNLERHTFLIGSGFGVHRLEKGCADRKPQFILTHNGQSVRHETGEHRVPSTIVIIILVRLVPQ